MYLKAVIHVDQAQEEILNTALGNIQNFLEEVTAQPSDVRMIVNHKAVQWFTKTGSGEYAEMISALASEGVRFLICNNSISKLKIAASDLLDDCEIVPAGIVEAIRLQNDGFAYVKP